MAGNKIELTVVVNGQAFVVEGNLNAPLHTIVPKALELSGNTGQPLENWELRDAQGTLLDASKKIGSFGFTPETQLFLNLKAGVGGER
jgi:Protein of Unknown function (DUF2604)